MDFKKLFFAAALCLGFAAPLQAAELPVIKTGFIFTTHHTPLFVAANKGAEFQTKGVWLKEMAPRESYQLMQGETPVALLDFVVAKSGSETATLFAQKHLDIGIASITAIMTGVDKGTPMKIVCPLQTEGMALIAPKDSALNSFDDFMAQVKAAKEPVKVGFHSPTSAPKIVLEGALVKAGLKVTLDPSDMTANILMVDLKDTSNLLAALNAKQVDAVVGPSPFPEVAVSKGVGKVLIKLGDLPPAGYWANFPCCVGVASDEMIKTHPEIVEAFVKLIVQTNAWCNENPGEAGEIAAQWIGIPAEAGRMNSLVFLNEFTEAWYRGAGSYLDVLNSMNKFNGSFKGKKLADIQTLLFDNSFVEKLKK